MHNIPGFKIERKLGSGGMGDVYEAVDEALERKVAIKVLAAVVADADTRAELIARMKREAKAAARIESPHTARVLQLGAMPDDGSPYIVMELVEGRSLRRELITAPEGVLSPARVVRIARQLAAGLGAAHAQGVVHRDLKPSNIYLAGDNDHVKILDFGVARIVDEPALTERGVVIGTYDYMAPEQLAGHTVDARADVYALGAVMFELLTGQRAFKERNPVALLQEQQAFSFSRVPRRMTLPSGVVEVVSRCLRLERDERFADMRAVDEALAAALDTPSVDVGRDAPTQPMHKIATDIDAATEIMGASSREAKTYETERGSASVTSVGRGVVVVRLVGVADERIARFVRPTAEEWLPAVPAGATLRVYFDITPMRAFNNAFRRAMFNWQAETKGRVEQIILVRSRVVAAIIQQANRLLGGGASVTAQRDRWEAAWMRDVAARDDDAARAATRLRG